MLLRGFDYMFLSLLLQVTVDVVSKFDDEGNPKRKKRSVNFLLSTHDPCPPTFH